MQNKKVLVIGAGLAGCEAAWQLSKRGVDVELWDMKPEKKSPAHTSEYFAELVCSNSLKAKRIESASGLLKEELRRLGSLLIECADSNQVPAGGALAVDRDSFSKSITDKILGASNISFVQREMIELPQSVLDNSTHIIIATGPLTSDAFLEQVRKLIGESELFFFDAAAPIVSKDSIDMSKVFYGSRYGRGGDDYLNSALDKDEYFNLVNELINSEKVHFHEFENDKTFDACQPVEVLASRGEMTLAFGPLKPVGIENPHSGERPFAVVQLRQDNASGSLYNMVGFQTRLTFSEQKRVFRMIPGLENAEFERYGVMHKNAFIKSPGFLNSGYQVIDMPNIFFAGQITGVEGYVESIASGMIAGIAAAKSLGDEAMPVFPSTTALGALSRHVSSYVGSNYQPMGITFGLIDSLDYKIRNKKERYAAISQRALEAIDIIKNQV